MVVDPDPVDSESDYNSKVAIGIENVKAICATMCSYNQKTKLKLRLCYKLVAN